MSKLSDLIIAVREEHLTKDQLENYYTELTNLLALMHIEISEKEKLEALFLEGEREGTAVAASRKWAATPTGQRQIELKHFIRATEKLVANVKHRVYQFI